MSAANRWTAPLIAAATARHICTAAGQQRPSVKGYTSVVKDCESEDVYTVCRRRKPTRRSIALPDNETRSRATKSIAISEMTEYRGRTRMDRGRTNVTPRDRRAMVAGLRALQLTVYSEPMSRGGRRSKHTQ